MITVEGDISQPQSVELLFQAVKVISLADFLANSLKTNMLASHVYAAAWVPAVGHEVLLVLS